VRRNYRGGAGIDRLQATSVSDTGGFHDGDRPEEWVASLVDAQNPGLTVVENEGLSRCALSGEPLLVDVLKNAPEFYLGKRPGNNIDLGFLLKILDSSMRLHVQAHPTSGFAREKLGSPYGKFECYYILSVREGTQGYIRLGFQRLPSRSEWRRIIASQDIGAMDACFEKIPVRLGEIWYIPGGLAHAIGENILMLEIMEPSDLVVRCEFEREGIMVPPVARFMGRDLDFCMDIFDYTEHSAAEIAQKYRLQPVLLPESRVGTSYEELAAAPVAPFTVRRLRLEAGAEITLGPGSLSGPQVAIVTQGSVVIKVESETVTIRQGRSIFIAAAAKRLEISANEKVELCFVSGVA
jgi:mannose-6-phosphate isomerase